MNYIMKIITSLEEPDLLIKDISETIKNERKNKNKERNKDLKKQFVYQSELDKTCFQHDMTYVNFKDLIRRTASGQILHHKAFIIARISKYGRCQRGFSSIAYNFLDKETSGSVIKNENISNQDLAEELHKTSNKKI